MKGGREGEEAGEGRKEGGEREVKGGREGGEREDVNTLALSD